MIERCVMKTMQPAWPPVGWVAAGLATNGCCSVLILLVVGERGDDETRHFLPLVMIVQTHPDCVIIRMT